MAKALAYINTIKDIFTGNDITAVQNNLHLMSKYVTFQHLEVESSTLRRIIELIHTNINIQLDDIHRHLITTSSRLALYGSMHYANE